MSGFSYLECLLLRFLEGDVLAELLAELFELDLTLYLTAILSSPVYFAGLLILNLNQLIL